jgi:disease resistance protein RPM1
MQLQLHSSKLKEDSIGLLASLPRLFDLSLVDAYEEKSLIFAAGVFPVLRKLRLDDLANLSHLEFQQGSLVNLDKLMLSQCFELTKIPQGIENLVHLKNLELSDMPIELTEQIQKGQESEGKHQDALHTTIVKVLHTHNGLLLEKKVGINLCALQK